MNWSERSFLGQKCRVVPNAANPLRVVYGAANNNERMVDPRHAAELDRAIAAGRVGVPIGSVTREAAEHLQMMLAIERDGDRFISMCNRKGVLIAAGNDAPTTRGVGLTNEDHERSANERNATTVAFSASDGRRVGGWGNRN